VNDTINNNAGDSQVKVLVTRPSHQTQRFAGLLKDAGLTPVLLPTIEIEFVMASIESAFNSNLIIFTSVNSVTGAHQNLPMPWTFNGRIAAIGEATKNALLEYQNKVDLVPSIGSSSEALLATIDEPPGSTVTIVRGDHGREKLYQSLTYQGMSVQYLQVYKRKLPGYSQSTLDQLFAKGLPQMISVTSDLGLANLLKIVPAPYLPHLFKCPLVVNSDRCAISAKKAGFTNSIVVANPPGDISQFTEVSRLAIKL